MSSASSESTKQNHTAPTVAQGAAGASTSDGRLNRSLVTRKKIVEALCALIQDGTLRPTAEQVAARANVGLRTVFSHFEDMEMLYREISAKLEEMLAPTQKFQLQGETWKQRLSDGIAKRCEMFERVAAFHLASQAVRHQSDYVHQQLITSAQVQRGLLTHLLPKALSAQQVTLESLDLAMSLDAWIRLRREQGLDAHAAQQVVRHMVGSLIGGLEDA